MSMPCLLASQADKEWWQQKQAELLWPTAGAGASGEVSMLNPSGSSGTSWAQFGSSTGIILTWLILWDDSGCVLVSSHLIPRLVLQPSKSSNEYVSYLVSFQKTLSCIYCSQSVSVASVKNLTGIGLDDRKWSAPSPRLENRELAVCWRGGAQTPKFPVQNLSILILWVQNGRLHCYQTACWQSFMGNDRIILRVLYHWPLLAAFRKILQERDNLELKWDGQKARKEKCRYPYFFESSCYISLLWQKTYVSICFCWLKEMWRGFSLLWKTQKLKQHAVFALQWALTEAAVDRVWRGPTKLLPQNYAEHLSTKLP